MGNKQSETQKQLAVEISHPRFSKSKIISGQKQSTLQTTQSLEEKQYTRWTTAIKKYEGHQSSNLLLPISHSFERAGLCGNTGSLIINYPNHPYLLSEEIYNRKGMKTRFSEPQIWFLLHSLSKARVQAASVGQRLGDIRPRNVFLNREGDIKVAHSLAWPLEVTNLQKALDKIPTYLAPEDLDKISKGELSDGPGDVSQAYSIGLSVLSAGNLADYENLYDLQNNILNLGGLSEALKLWAHNYGYSEVLRGTVLLLLNLQPEKRLTVSELIEMLEKHALHIQAKQNFVIDNAPPKLHEEILHLRESLAPPSYLLKGAPQPLFSSQYKLESPKLEELKP